jgi:Fe-S cluster assembly ATP-binding protein
LNILDIDNLQAETAGKQILNGLDLHVKSGEVHAIMGPNGSGKSTLGKILAGHPEYRVTDGTILYKGSDIVGSAPHDLSRAGIFLAFQYPTEIPGVSNMEFLKASLDAHHKTAQKEQLSTAEFIRSVRELAAGLGLNPEFLKRGVNEGFSGGEKKRNEILQLKLLNPSLAILDETDSGLDIDALKVVSEGINGFRSSDNAIVLITHYQRLLDYIVPDHVHVLSEGKIIQTGDKSLALELEEKGYSWLN